MAVEVLILSGARQGERLVFDGRELRVGSDPGCEVFFDPERDRASQGRSAVLRLQEDGWYIRCAGGEVLVNQQPVAGWTRIRSGDVVRMSESGPDFSFGIVASGAIPAPVRLPKSSCQTTGKPLAALDMPLAASHVSSTAKYFHGDAPIAELAPPAAIPQAIGGDRRWATWAIGGAALACVAFLMGRSLLSPPTVVVEVHQPPPPPPPAPATTSTATSTDSGSKSAATENGKTDGASKATETGGEKKGEKKTGGEKSQAADVATRLGEAVFLIQVAKANRSWPFATCTAISGDTLLTTAREATQLAKWREQEGFTIWVTRPASGFKEEVQDIRINGVFASLADKPTDWIYYDMGLLTVHGKLPKAAPLASAAELAAVEEGIPVACFGFTHEGEKITRFDKFEPRLTQGKVYVITVSQDLPGRPRLLHVRAELPRNPYGSPVVNAEGKLIGLYGEAVAAPADKAAASGGAEFKNMHYVTVVNPEMIDLWLRDRDAKMWPPAATPSTTPKKQEHP